MVTYDELVALRDAAWTCNELAIDFLESGRTVGLSRSRYGKRPYIEPAATTQAIQYLDMTQRDAERLQGAAASWHRCAYGNTECPLDWIKVALQGKGRTFTIADKSIYTAHAATEKMVEYALSVWEEFEHLDEKRLAIGIAKCKRNAVKLRNLHGYIESEFETAVAELDKATLKPSSPPLTRPTDKRDAFIYQEAMKGVSWKTILTSVKKRKTWEIITTVPGIKAAATRYAERNKLAHPPSRQRKN
jgi:hypothetical protein